MRTTFLATLALTLAAVPVQAEPQVLKPSSPWNADFGEEKCRLTRLFGEGENRHMLIFEQYWPGERPAMTLAGPLFKPFTGQVPVRLSFWAEQEPLRTEPFAGSAGEYGDAIVYPFIHLAKGIEPEASYEEAAARPPWLDTDLAGRAEFVDIKQGKHDVRFSSGPMKEVFKVLSLCGEDLIASWGLDPEKHRTAVQMPLWINQASVARLISSTYPTEAVIKGEQGVFSMRVIVSETGTVEDCVIFKATITERLDSPACREMQRAKFKPALDAEGKPMRSFYGTTIAYRLG